MSIWLGNRIWLVQFLKGLIRGRANMNFFVFCFVHVTVAHTYEMRKNNMKPITYTKERS